MPLYTCIQLCNIDYTGVNKVNIDIEPVQYDTQHVHTARWHLHNATTYMATTPRRS